MARDLQQGLLLNASKTSFICIIFEAYCITEIIVEVIKADRASTQVWWSYLFFQLKLKGGMAD